MVSYVARQIHRRGNEVKSVCFLVSAMKGTYIPLLVPVAIKTNISTSYSAFSKKGYVKGF